MEGKRLFGFVSLIKGKKNIFLFLAWVSSMHWKI